MDIVALQDTLRRTAAELLRIAEQAGIALSADTGAKTHVLVDWENVQPKEDDCRKVVPEATDVWLFHGPMQKNVGAHYDSFGRRVTPVGGVRAGKNALDFLLSFYLGYLASKEPNSRFVVLSNDKGYGPMLEHANALGFSATQSGFGGARKRAGTAAKKSARRSSAAPPAAKKNAAKKAAGKSSAGKSTAAKTTASKRTAEKSSAGKTTAAKSLGARTTAAKSTSGKTPAAKTAARRTASTKTASAKTTAAEGGGGRSNARKSAAAKTAAAHPGTPTNAPARRLGTPKTFDQVLAILRKGSESRRPAKLRSLLAQLASLIGGGAGAADAQAMLDRLVAERHVAVDQQGTLSWRL
jgi:hypothetical protein